MGEPRRAVRPDHGQYRSTQLTSGQTDDLLMITMAHRGRSGDGDEELATLELLFEDGHGIPLTTPEASSLVGKLAIYLDDGSGAFEINSDTLVAGVDSLSLTGGIQTVALTDGDANVQVQFGAPRIYFAVVEMTADAYTQTAVDQFRVTHVTASSSTAQDRDHGIPLILEYAADAGTGNVAVPVTRVWDGGGATPIWSEAANWASDVVPRHSTDGVRFDSTSTKNAVVDKGFANTIMRLTIASGYAGQITQNADLTISGDWVQDVHRRRQAGHRRRLRPRRRDLHRPVGADERQAAASGTAAAPSTPTGAASCSTIRLTRHWPLPSTT